MVAHIAAQYDHRNRIEPAFHHKQQYFLPLSLTTYTPLFNKPHKQQHEILRERKNSNYY